MTSPKADPGWQNGFEVIRDYKRINCSIFKPMAYSLSCMFDVHIVCHPETIHFLYTTNI